MAGKSSVGKRIRTFREERNVDLETLSQNTGLTVNFLERMENDEIYPTIGPLQKVARSLAVWAPSWMTSSPAIPSFPA